MMTVLPKEKTTIDRLKHHIHAPKGQYKCLPMSIKHFDSSLKADVLSRLPVRTPDSRGAIH
jgi:hypothetical protein